MIPRDPLLLDVEEPQDQGDAIYRIRQPDRGCYLLQKMEADGWFSLCSFVDGMYTEADCLCGHHYSATHPDAIFVNNLDVIVTQEFGINLIAPQLITFYEGYCKFGEFFHRS